MSDQPYSLPPMPSADDQSGPASIPAAQSFEDELVEALSTPLPVNAAAVSELVYCLPVDAQAALNAKDDAALSPDNEPVDASEPAPILGVVTPEETTAPAEKARVRLLREAAGLITGDREHEYGTPQVNFPRIADLWNVQFNHLLAEDKKFQPVDVALGMIQVKMGRAVQTPNEDTFKDIAGYTGIAYELTQDED